MSEALRATGATRRSTVVLTTRAPASAVRAVATDLDSWRAGGAVVITPGPLAARALGVAHRSLTDLALAVLAGRGIRFAGALTRRAALQAAVEDTWSVDDVAGTARSVESTVRELLTAGTGAFVEGGPMIDLDARAHRASAMADYPRLGRLIDLVAAYRRHLTAEAVVDRAEALWLAAADASPEGPRATLVVCGYPLLAPAELAFVTAYAAAGSLLVLPQAHGEGARTPVSPDSFAPNEEAAAELA
ncbi:MAG TPA: hypothetical protein VFN03_02895, partial [Trueperaceae bacterium]|nr:hypothetical protein [Trueperaceae bacterium]